MHRPCYPCLADVFSFGMLLWQLVTSEPIPYGKLTVPQILLGVSQGTVRAGSAGEVWCVRCVFIDRPQVSLVYASRNTKSVCVRMCGCTMRKGCQI